MTFHKGGPRQQFPRKGTKLRAIMLLMLREQGVCAYETAEIGLCNKPNTFGTRKIYLTDSYNFHIISWTIKSPSGGRPWTKYRIIGRWREDGRYLDYLARKIKN
ncbi:hypothetical protein KAR91_64185 [Candidatus Pacearchaeota archaeon]|nr:hypothetical protein [Candidatus Pacearchaeota archaeon]